MRCKVDIPKKYHSKSGQQFSGSHSTLEFFLCCYNFIMWKNDGNSDVVKTEVTGVKEGLFQTKIVHYLVKVEEDSINSRKTIFSNAGTGTVLKITRCGGLKT